MGYNFGEKTKEMWNGKELPVWQSPKYEFAKKKVIEMLESEQYKNVLETSDFWILMNGCSNNTKVMYSGLIISHNGCLKINDTLEDRLKFKPECVSIDTNGYNGELVFHYCNIEQGLYEVGEVSAKNCKNEYPYAMALKRCFDRVVLKNSKLAYAGVYSDSEADEFTKKDEVQEIDQMDDKQLERIELENKCKVLGIDLKSSKTQTWIATKLEESSGRKELDEKFNLGQYNQILAFLIRNKEKENG